jgi:hypothetical protein
MEHEMTVTDYLARKGFQYKRRGDTGVFNCPFCDPPDREQKFGISLSDGSFNCLHLNRCGSKGSFTEFQRKLGDKPVSLDGRKFVEMGKKKTYKTPNVIVKKPINKVLEYLHKRGLTDNTIEHFGFGSYNDDTVMIPFYRGGEIVTVKYRSITDKKRSRSYLTVATLKETALLFAKVSMMRRHYTSMGLRRCPFRWVPGTSNG